MIIHNIPQRSPEWFALRLGKPTASEFHKILTAGGKASKQSEGYAHWLLAEQMLGQPLDTVETQYMIRGQELEDSAIEAYEFLVGSETSPGGFVTDDDMRYGCSPDRLVGEDGVLEIKCPAPNTHVGYLLSREIDGEKKPQVQGQLLITGRQWVDLVSYHPELPPLVKRVVRDEKYIDLLRIALETFCGQLLLMRAQLEQEPGQFRPITFGQKPAADDMGGMGITDEDLAAWSRECPTMRYCGICRTTPHQPGP